MLVDFCVDNDSLQGCISCILILFNLVAGASRCDQCSHGQNGDSQFRFIFLLASCACGLARQQDGKVAFMGV
jgi:hypothetical protein